MTMRTSSRHLPFLVAAATAAALAAGCVVAPFRPPMGAFTSVRAPLSLEYAGTPMRDVKVGTVESYSILGLVAWGDIGLAAAAKQGGLKTIHHADYDYLNIFGIYQRTTLLVYGE